MFALCSATIQLPWKLKYSVECLQWDRINFYYFICLSKTSPNTSLVKCLQQIPRLSVHFPCAGPWRRANQGNYLLRFFEAGKAYLRQLNFFGCVVKSLVWSFSKEIVRAVAKRDEQSVSLFLSLYGSERPYLRDKRKGLVVFCVSVCLKLLSAWWSFKVMFIFFIIIQLHEVEYNECANQEQTYTGFFKYKITICPNLAWYFAENEELLVV